MPPDISTLSLYDPGPLPAVKINGNIEETDDRYMQKLKNYAKSVPYSIEPHSKMMKMLDFIMLRIAQCIDAKDYDVGFLQWDSMLTYWS
ncbi:hypothetical protein MPER_03824, partial [Moniliophthora perniciosa FA553]